MENLTWHKVLDKANLLKVGEVTTVYAGHEQVCLSRTEEGFGAICNSCPHQGGPLGEGFIDTLDDGKQYVICPWHGYEYHVKNGSASGGYDDVSAPFLVEEREDGIYVAVQQLQHQLTIMDQVVETMIDWGVNTVFGMVGHSNLGLADAFYRRSEAGDLTYIGIRHEGAAAFAASAYGKLEGKPAVCFTIAGPGATNLYTGLWDAKVDRAPVLAMTGQVDTKFLGPHNFQEIPTEAAFQEVAAWSQTVHSKETASELMALAIKNAIAQRDVSLLVFPDEVQTLPGLEVPPRHPRQGRLAMDTISPPLKSYQQAIELLNSAKRPAIIVGNGARAHYEAILQLAEKLNAPIITTFKAKGTIPESHQLAVGVLGRSGTPVASASMSRSDVLLVLGATFSRHTGISTKKKLIQVDFDRMNLGKFHPVDVPLWGEIGQTVARLVDDLDPHDNHNVTTFIENRWEKWRLTKMARASKTDDKGRLMNTTIFNALSQVVPDKAVITVDVGNNTYSFGRYFESRHRHELVMSGYLGSIGFALPAAIGAAAARPRSKVIAVCGDGGLGQYLMEFTTLVKYNLNVSVILLNNSELAKITKEQRNAKTHVFGTSLVNPDFSAFATSCGGLGLKVERTDQLLSALKQAIDHEGPSLVEIISTSDPK